MGKRRKKVWFQGLNPKVNSLVKIDPEKLKLDFEKLDDSYSSLYAIFQAGGMQTPIGKNPLLENAEEIMERAISGEVGTVKAIGLSKVIIEFPDGYECKVSNKSIIKL